MINNRQNSRRRGRGGSSQQRPTSGSSGQRDGGNRIDSRARGNAAQLLEKYKNMARDAQLSGDRVQVETYLQFADHYFRVLADSRARSDDHRPIRPVDDFDGSDEEYGEEGEPIRSGEQGDNRQPQYQQPQYQQPQHQQPQYQQPQYQQPQHQQPGQSAREGQQPRRDDGQQPRRDDGQQPRRDDARRDEPRRDDGARREDVKRDDTRRDTGRRDEGQRDDRPRRDYAPREEARAGQDGQAADSEYLERVANDRDETASVATPIEAEAKPSRRSRTRSKPVETEVDDAPGLDASRLPPALGPVVQTTDGQSNAEQAGNDQAGDQDVEIVTEPKPKRRRRSTAPGDAQAS